MTTTEPSDLTDWKGKFVRIFAAFDPTKKFPLMTEGEVIAVITSPSLVVRDKHGHTQAWPVTLPIEEVPTHEHRWTDVTARENGNGQALKLTCETCGLIEWCIL